MTGNPTIRVRASSWGALFDCAKRWKAEHLDGKKRPSSPRALLGTAFHASTAAYDKAILAHSPISITDAVGVLVDEIREPRQEVDWSVDTLSPKEVERIGTQLHVMYCRDWSPQFEFEAVEFPLQEPLSIPVNGVTIELVGTLDRMRVVRPAVLVDQDGRALGSVRQHGVTLVPAGRKLIDLKSGRRAVAKGKARTKGHHAQLGVYELLYTHATGLPMTEPAAILGALTEGAPEIALTDAPGTREMMLGDGTEDGKGLIEEAADMFRAGVFPPNPNSPLCDRRFCPVWQTCTARGR